MHGSGQLILLAALNYIILGWTNIWDANHAYQTFKSIRNIFGLILNIHSINALKETFRKTKKLCDNQGSLICTH